MKNIITLVIAFIAAPVLATDTLDCGNDEYHFSIHVGHNESGDIISNYELNIEGKILIESNNFSSKISWVKNDLESKKNLLNLSDTKNEVKIILSKTEQYFTYKGNKYAVSCDWER